MSVEERKSYPLQVEQVMRSDAEKAKLARKKREQASKQRKRAQAKGQGKAGRPKGRKNQDKRQIEWTPELNRVARMAAMLLKRLKPCCAIAYFVLDGHFGNNQMTQMVRQCLGLHLISKLRSDSTLYFRYEGPQKAKGRNRLYGAKVDYQQLPARYRVRSTTEKGVQTDVYQAILLHKRFAEPINVVILVKTNLSTHKRAHVVLFSSDLELEAERLIDFYHLRFQIEFNFRDAKQFWGFEDFMNVKQTPIHNAVGLSFFMVNLSALLIQRYRLSSPHFGVLDLKALFCSRRFAAETLKLLPDSLDPILLQHLLDDLPSLGAIHPQPAPSLVT